ncbi:MAG: DUF4367 domain-containing protein [Ruminococcus sp.]|nr:DUF4367 domain-containing protein [Ruminococcus sp.]
MTENLYRAFEETAVSRIIEKVPQMPDHKFSRKFKRKMRKLMKSGGIEPADIRKFTVRQLFVYVTVAIVTAVITAVSVGAARLLFNSFSMQPFKTHTIVESVDYENAPETILDVYEFEVPPGFELTESRDFTPMVGFSYESSDNSRGYIDIDQFVKKGYRTYVNTEDRPMSAIDINGHEGYIIDLGNGEYFISWDNGDYIFEVSGKINKNILIDVAESGHKAE